MNFENPWIYGIQDRVECVHPTPYRSAILMGTALSSSASPLHIQQSVGWNIPRTNCSRICSLLNVHRINLIFGTYKRRSDVLRTALSTTSGCHGPSGINAWIMNCMSLTLTINCHLITGIYSLHELSFTAGQHGGRGAGNGLYFYFMKTRDFMGN